MHASKQAVSVACLGEMLARWPESLPRRSQQKQDFEPHLSAILGAVGYSRYLLAGQLNVQY